MARKKVTPVEEVPFMSEINYDVEADLFESLAAGAMVADATDVPQRPKQVRTSKTRRPNPFAARLQELYGEGRVLVLANVRGENLSQVVNKIRNGAGAGNLSTEMTITNGDDEVVSFTRAYIKDELPGLADATFTIWAKPVARKSRSKAVEGEPEY